MPSKLIGSVLAASLCPLAYEADVGKDGKISASPVYAQDTGNQWNRSGAYVVGLAGYDLDVLKVEGLEGWNGKLMAGAGLGYNWRVSQHFLLGLEADWMFTGISVNALEELIKASTTHLITVRARAGIPMGHALVYVTAGPAWQDVRLTAGDLSSREWHLGAAVGGGVELEVT